MRQELGIQQRKPVNYSPQKDVFVSGPLPTSAGESGLPLGLMGFWLWGIQPGTERYL